jgi:hypothetical protein
MLIITQADRPLVSISLGCDALFIVGRPRSNVSPLEEYYDYHLIKLHSGDLLVMKDDARYAWHGVRKIIPDTCPDYLRDCFPDRPQWKDFMASRRININVRQMGVGGKDKALVETRRQSRSNCSKLCGCADEDNQDYNYRPRVTDDPSKNGSPVFLCPDQERGKTSGRIG